MTKKKSSAIPPAAGVELPANLSPEMLAQIGAFIDSKVREAVTAAGTTSLAAETAMAAIAQSQADLAVMAADTRRALHRENPNYEEVSVYNYDPACTDCRAKRRHAETGLLGHPKPRFIYETWFCNGIVREDWCTPAEIALYNQFTKSVTCRDETWKATISRDGTKRRLHVEVPYRGADARVDLPSQAAILIELLYGTEVADPAQAMAMILQLQQQVAALTARAMAAPPPVHSEGASI